jgi:hypothetical protein
MSQTDVLCIVLEVLWGCCCVLIAAVRNLYKRVAKLEGGKK